MRVLIVTNVHEQKGLYKDGVVLGKLLSEWGHTPYMVDFRDGGNPDNDLVIFLEVIETRFFNNQRMWWIPNPEWVRPEHLSLTNRFEWVLCKTQDAFRLLDTPCRVYTGFTCEDKYREVQRQKSFFHTGRGSTAKGTNSIIQARKQMSFPLTLATNLDDETLTHEQNRCLFHLLPSEYEGWGHSLHEALSVGAVVVTTKIPPMSEMAVSHLIPPARLGKRGLATTGQVDAQGIIDAVKWCQGLSDQEIQEYSTRSRQAYLGETQFFRQALRGLLG